MVNKSVSDTLSYPSQFVEVYGSKMHFIEAGAGDTILFLHGIPTSSYIWRNIIPHLTQLGHCIAPDLIGFGQSDKPNISYSIRDHIRYIEKFIEVLKLKRITLIMHGWGSLIGFDYAMRHEKNCKGLVFYEAFLRSLNEENFSLPFQEQLLSLQSLENTEGMNHGSDYIDLILPQTVMGELTEEEMTKYRQPFMQNGTDKPITQYLNELLDANNKQKIDTLIADYSAKLTRSQLPKLMLYSIPGFITTIATVMWAKKNLNPIEIVDIGEELHLAQESNPQLIGETISVWLQGIERT